MFKLPSLFIALIALAACTTPDTSRAPWHSDLDRQDCCLDIAHAGGKLNGMPYTNSLEALTLNAAKGRRVFELDVSLTSDGHLVLAHDWDRFQGRAPGLDVFTAQDLGYTPTPLKTFLGWLEQDCDGCTFVTDAKDDFWTFWHAFAQAVPRDMREDRFIVQTYSVAQSLKLAKIAPQQRQILTLYLQDTLSARDLSALKNQPQVIALTMPLNRVPAWAKRVTASLALPVYTHAYPWMMENSALLSFARAYGVRGYYMD